MRLPPSGREGGTSVSDGDVIYGPEFVSSTVFGLGWYEWSQISCCISLLCVIIDVTYMLAKIIYRFHHSQRRLRLKTPLTTLCCPFLN